MSTPRRFTHGRAPPTLSTGLNSERLAAADRTDSEPSLPQRMPPTQGSQGLDLFQPARVLAIVGGQTDLGGRQCCSILTNGSSEPRLTLRMRSKGSTARTTVSRLLYRLRSTSDCCTSTWSRACRRKPTWDKMFESIGKSFKNQEAGRILEKTVVQFGSRIRCLSSQTRRFAPSVSAKPGSRISLSNTLSARN